MKYIVSLRVEAISAEEKEHAAIFSGLLPQEIRVTGVFSWHNDIFPHFRFSAKKFFNK